MKLAIMIIFGLSLQSLTIAYPMALLSHLTGLIVFTHAEWLSFDQDLFTGICMFLMIFIPARLLVSAFRKLSKTSLARFLLKSLHI